MASRTGLPPPEVWPGEAAPVDWVGAGPVVLGEPLALPEAPEDAEEETTVPVSPAGIDMTPVSEDTTKPVVAWGRVMVSEVESVWMLNASFVLVPVHVRKVLIERVESTHAKHGSTTQTS